MNDSLRWRCELTPELLDRAEPELGAILATWSDLAYQRAQASRRVPERALRAAGIATAAIGILVAWAAIILAPECARGQGAALLSYGAIPVFVVCGTVFGFWPGFAAELRGWLRRSAGRRARRLLAPVRRRAPYQAEYLLSGSRLEARIERFDVRRATDLASIGAAVAGAHLACLFGRRWPGVLHRVVWFPDHAVRRAVCDALRAAGAEVTEIPEPVP